MRAQRLRSTGALASGWPSGGVSLCSASGDRSGVRAVLANSRPNAGTLSLAGAREAGMARDASQRPAILVVDFALKQTSQHKTPEALEDAIKERVKRLLNADIIDIKPLGMDLDEELGIMDADFVEITQEAEEDGEYVEDDGDE